FTTCFQIMEVAPDAINLPIGHALAGTSVFVLDERFQPLAPGVIGELCIGGPRLARGYWRRPELTAACFVPNPFADAEHAGDRLYCSGDLVRLTPAGELE